MGKKRIHKCPAFIACRRVYNHACWLVDHQKVFILIKNIKFDVLWDGLGQFRLRYDQIKSVACLDLGRHLGHRITINAELAVFDQCLDP